MKRYIKQLSACVMAATVLSSCTKNFESINTSPNDALNPNTTLLLSNALRSLGSQTEGVAGWAKDLYPQYMSEIQYTSESRFQNTIYNFYPIYNVPLQDLQTIIALNMDPVASTQAYVTDGGDSESQIGVARVLKAFYFMHMTDRWGMIPYSEALQGRANLTPSYDSQESVYNALFVELTEAQEQLGGGGPVRGDILFNGNVGLWAKWANTLRMAAALHIRKVNPEKARTEFLAAYEAGAMTTNADNALFRYLNDANNQSPLFNNYEVTGRVDYAVSEYMIEQLELHNDPRLPIFALPALSTGTYVGMPFGLIQGQTGAYNRENVSLIGDRFTAQNSVLPLSTYAQVEFMLAEAAFLGWIPDAQTHYLNGIRASFSQYEVEDLEEAYTAYVAQPSVAYSTANGLERIITQKWFANYMANGYESWTDWRRTGFPVLDPGPAPQNTNGSLPRRQGYTTEEAGRNSQSYQAAIGQQGPDALTTRVWWDVED
ncbi:SusD/RagB family nutrient-binding outer membrane lipoprotein [Sphingobacterium sp. lm-10]|uniref:SusD/RagB family nutrient-binding outer membrane lipoprotein n=1 Tax=Sphingobacterium sp. lm-10 TaxID=2944904 RepID=UPI0020227DFA|nr:SusD/RagB family nutrient-binding outer membrane lipoprotein [Sphingobacterium sp. lm-10]MCL7988073.1 SusD/RagB family nutrient-binding outer membrane lipoprotein [Sphingobacterium sp. lm-10]